MVTAMPADSRASAKRESHAVGRFLHFGGESKPIRSKNKAVRIMKGGRRKRRPQPSRLMMLLELRSSAISQGGD